jgi:hypothetical protein
MAKRTPEELEVRQHAQHVFSLVRAEREEEALSTLLALGPNVVAVAHALILGEFGRSPIRQMLDRARERAFMILFAVLPFVVCVIFPVPPEWEQPISAHAPLHVRCRRHPDL